MSLAKRGPAVIGRLLKAWMRWLSLVSKGEDTLSKQHHVVLSKARSECHLLARSLQAPVPPGLGFMSQPIGAPEVWRSVTPEYEHVWPESWKAGA
jgi:hypothetical protein